MITLVIYSTLALLAADAPNSNEELATQVSRLVRQLDAAQLGERDTAERKLLELGPPALSLLPSIDARTSAEVATRVARVQQRLLKAQAVAASEPTSVTLKGKDMPIAAVFEEITKQTGNKISDYRGQFGEDQADTKVSVDFEKTPFWKALDSVLDQAELSLYGFTGERGAFVVRRPPDASARSSSGLYAGLFRLDPLRFEAVRDLRNSKMESLKFYFEVSWEPRLQPFAILQPMGQVTATGDNGEAIAVSGNEAEPEAMIREGMSTAELEVPLALPKRSINKISSLKGKFLALVPGPSQEFRFTGLAAAPKNTTPKRVELRKASATVTIDQVRKNNNIWEVSLRVKIEGPSRALESHRGWILENQAYFEDANKERIDPGGIEQTLQSNEEVGINYFFELKDGPEKLTFIYNTPITVLEVPVEYEFRDLQLP